MFVSYLCLLSPKLIKCLRRVYATKERSKYKRARSHPFYPCVPGLFVCLSVCLSFCLSVTVQCATDFYMDTDIDALWTSIWILILMLYAY